MIRTKNQVLILISLLLFLNSVIEGSFLDLGCLTIDPNEATGIDSTVTPETSPVAIRLYNGNSVNQSYVVSVNNGVSILDQPGFDVSKSTSLLILGYRQNNVSLITTTMVQALLDKGETNVVLVDWSEYSSKDYFTALNASVVTVPNLLEDMIQQMIEREYSIKKIHPIGFSMGATIAGHLGRKFKSEKFPLITGLDPAGPLIGLVCETNLNKGDAEFVQILHGDRDVYATSQLCGDLDVPLNNNGFRPQPGCPCRLIPFQFSRNEVCSHVMTWRIYADSIRDPQSFLGVLCGSYDDFKAGRFKNNIKTLAGYDVDTSIRGQLYITTNANLPFGKGNAGTMP